MSENEKMKAAAIAEKFQSLDYSEQRYVEGYMQGVQSAQSRLSAEKERDEEGSTKSEKE